jgi:hypothetical protein
MGKVKGREQVDETVEEGRKIRRVVKITYEKVDEEVKSGGVDLQVGGV